MRLPPRWVFLPRILPLVLSVLGSVLSTAFVCADVSYRGFYSGTLSTGARVGFYANTNSDVTVMVIDPAASTFGANNTAKFSTTGALTGTYSIATISGQISADGRLTGTVSPFGLTIDARRAPLSGPTQAFDGYYQGWIFDPNNRMLAMTLVASADGQLYMFIQDGPDVVDAGFGTIDARGIFNFRDASNRVASGSIVTTANGLVWNGRYSKTGAGAYTFVIGRRTAANKLINIATRGLVQPGANALIAGFAIEGGAKTVLIRGVGPGLAQFGVAGALTDPQLALVEGEKQIASNDDWHVTTAATSAAEVRDTSGRVGAFALAENSKDAVLLIRLETGRYTAVLSGGNNGSGLGLIEVYEVQ